MERLPTNQGKANQNEEVEEISEFSESEFFDKVAEYLDLNGSQTQKSLRDFINSQELQELVENETNQLNSQGSQD